MRYSYMLPILAMLLISGVANASPLSANSGLISYLSAYVPNAILANSTFTNITYSSNSYVLVGTPRNGSILVNTTSGYAIVLDNATAYKALGPYLIKKYFPNSTLINEVNASMALYKKQANPPLADCLIETGIGNLNLIANNTVTNNSATTACFTVPICRRSFYNFSGESGPLVQGIREFGDEYINMNNSYRSFFSLLHSLTPSDFYSNVQGMLTDVANLTSIEQTMPTNPIFPLPSNFNPSLLGSCSNYNQNDMPWYCQDIGNCEYTSFNATTLSNTGSQVSSLLALPVYNKTIEAYAQNVTKSASAFVTPVIISENTTRFDAFLSFIMPKYNATIYNATFILSKLSNSTLSYSLSELEARMASIISAGINQNITKSNATISAELKNVSGQTASLSAPYETAAARASNSTYSILLHELDYKSAMPKSLSLLALRQEQVDSMLSTKLSKSELDTVSFASANVSSSASSLGSPISMPAFIKGLDGGLATLMLKGGTAAVSAKDAAAPLYLALIAIAIAAILIFAFYELTYARLKAKRKLRLNRRVKKAWMALFIILALIGVAYAATVYSFAASANSFMPATSFMNALSSSSSVTIAVNGTSQPANSSVANCAAALQQTLKSFNKNASIVYVKGNACSSGSLTGAACYDALYSSGKPLIQLNANANSSYAEYRGMYGTAFYAGGSMINGAYCYLNGIVKQSLSK